MSNWSREEREEFAQKMRDRTRKFALETIRLCQTLPNGRTYGTIVFQLVKSSSSVGANYRAACRARSKKEFFAKMSIVVEETDESLYWLENIRDLPAPCDQQEVQRLIEEITEILKIVSKARNNAR